MIKPAFYTGRQELQPEECLQSILLMEIGMNSFTYVIADTLTNSLRAAAFFKFAIFDDRHITDALREVIYGNELLQNNFKDTVVVYNFPEATLTPENFYSVESSKKMLELVYGPVTRSLIMSEKLREFPAYTIYQVPADIHNLFQYKFSAGKYWHVYSLWLQSMNGKDQEDQTIHAIFHPDRLLVSIHKNKSLQLIQSFSYQTAEDVLFHLLNCCKQLHLEPHELMLYIGGFIDKDSALMGEISKYFLNYKFNHTEAETAQELPIHFFSHFVKMALCVS